MADKRPDAAHFHRRRFTRRYRAKQRVVKNLWITSGCLMLICPLPVYVLSLALATTLMAFMILDETA